MSEDLGIFVGDNVGLDTYDDVGFQASVANGQVFLSIVMPTCNEGHTIRRAVRQVLSTSHPCCTELIVADDESSAETAEQLDGLSCDRLKVCRNSPNMGKSTALLTGMGRSQWRWPTGESAIQGRSSHHVDNVP